MKDTEQTEHRKSTKIVNNYFSLSHHVRMCLVDHIKIIFLKFLAEFIYF